MFSFNINDIDNMMNNIQVRATKINKMISDKKYAFDNYGEFSIPKTKVLLELLNDEIEINAYKINDMIFKNAIEYIQEVTELTNLDEINDAYGYPKNKIHLTWYEIDLCNKVVVSHIEGVMEYYKNNIKKMKKDIVDSNEKIILFEMDNSSKESKNLFVFKKKIKNNSFDEKYIKEIENEISRIEKMIERNKEILKELEKFDKEITPKILILLNYGYSLEKKEFPFLETDILTRTEISEK